MRHEVMPLRIATIGRNGQTARALAACATSGNDIVLIQAGREEADLRRQDTLAAFVAASRPDVVINTGAYNLVDRAETERDEAFAVNADGARALARICAQRGVPFVHMSTDCVFDGAKASAYTEDDAPNPLSVYGASKLAGERAVSEENPDATTARVCWVFSEFADNFFSRMIALARTRPVLRVVDDQRGPPTYAPDIARALIALARAKHALPAAHRGLLHFAAPEVTDRASMARAILTESSRQGGPTAEVEPVSSAMFAAAARRPANAQLSAVRATAALGLAWTPWADALEASVRGVLARG